MSGTGSRRKKWNGQIAVMYLLFYGVGRFFIEGLRTDQLLIPGTAIAVSQALSLVLVIFSGAVLIYIGKKTKGKPYIK